MPTATSFFSTPPEDVTPGDEARFFGRLKVGNDTFKRTEWGRLARIDAWLIRHLQLAQSDPRSGLDIGISSGVTTLELADALRDAGLSIHLTGTDRSFQARLLDAAPFCRVLAEPEGHILQYDIAGRAIQPWLRKLDYVDGMVLVRGLLHLMLDRRARTKLRRGEGRAVALVSPRLSGSGAVALVESDVTVRDERLVGRFDLIRAANVLNRHYFDEESLQCAVANVRSYLSGPGSWLLVVRTRGNEEHNGSLMRLGADGRLAVVGRYGAGSEVEGMFAS